MGPTTLPLLDIPAPTTPLILDIPLCITPLILDILIPTTLDIPPSTRLPFTTKLKFKHAKLSRDPLFKRNKSLGKQPQLKNRFFFSTRTSVTKRKYLIIICSFLPNKHLIY